MGLVKYNANYNVLIKLSDEGVVHYVRKKNEGLSEKYHTSFMEVRKKESKGGYFEMQLHDFIDTFGNTGFDLQKLISLDIVLDSKHLKKIKP